MANSNIFLTNNIFIYYISCPVLIFFDTTANFRVNALFLTFEKDEGSTDFRRRDICLPLIASVHLEPKHFWDIVFGFDYVSILGIVSWNA